LRYFSPSSALQFGPGDEFYDPIYQAAEDNDLPLLVHSTNGTAPIDFPKQYTQMHTGVEQHTITHPFTGQWTLVSIIFKGIPERFPDLDVVIQESGVGWVPYFKARMNDHFHEHNHELPYLDRLPGEYIDENFYFTTQPTGMYDEGHHLAWAIQMAGVDNVMYAADLPHPDFDPPSELFDRIKNHFEPDAVRKIMGGTAIDVYGLDA
jgi:predicted TIM-barrel fold metal-dependent hydrolase